MSAQPEHGAREAAAASAKPKPERLRVEVEPILPGDLDVVAEFLHTHMDPRLSAVKWRQSLSTPWPNPGPNFGYCLAVEGEIVGVYTATYVDRPIMGSTERFCNLAAWYVLPQHRPHSLRLLKAILSQKDVHMTDLSPQPKIAELMRRFGFEHLDATSCVLANLPWWSRCKIVRDLDAIASGLSGAALRIFTDHRTLDSVRHLMLDTPHGRCHVMFQRRKKRGVPCTVVQHISNPTVLSGRYRALCCHFLRHDRTPVTILESRFLVGQPWFAKRLLLQPKLYRSQTLGPEHFDNLYSELVTLASPTQ